MHHLLVLVLADDVVLLAGNMAIIMECTLSIFHL